jgi:hypothetical protein
MQTAPCPSPGDHEWLKIVVSTVAGLFAGLVAEPIKNALQRRIEIGRMVRAIETDFTGLATLLRDAADPEEFKLHIWSRVDLPAYQHYWSDKRDFFYDNHRLNELRKHCAEVLEVKQKVLSGEGISANGLVLMGKAVDCVVKVRGEEEMPEGFRWWLRLNITRFQIASARLRSLLARLRRWTRVVSSRVQRMYNNMELFELLGMFKPSRMSKSFVINRR